MLRTVFGFVGNLGKLPSQNFDVDKPIAFYTCYDCNLKILHFYRGKNQT